MKNMVIFLLLIGAFLSETPAMADQNAASQPYVHAVETAYQQAVEKLSADGRKDLQRGQNEWMSFVKQYCDEKNLHWRYKTAEDCVAKYYEQREKQLKNYSITTKEGLVIRHAEYFAAHIEDISDDPDDDRTLWPAEVYISWPQIDNPANEAQRKWNAFMAKGMPNDEKTEGHYCDWQYTYSIPFTTPDFISVVQENWMYCHGAAHGYGGSKGINRILSADRSITSADIFKSSSGWEEALGKLAVEKLTAQDKNVDGHPNLIKNASRVEFWSFSPEGLKINFGSVDGYAGGAYISVISWDELKAYFKKGSILETPLKD